VNTYRITYTVTVETVDGVTLDQAADAVSMQLWELGIEWDGDIVTTSAKPEAMKVVSA